jgi:hypothetical protein
MGNLLIFFPSNRLIVFGDLSSNQEWEAILKADGSKSALAAEMMSYVNVAAQGHAWFVMRVSPSMKQSMEAAAAARQGSAPVDAAIHKAHAVCMWAKVDSNQLTFDVGFVCTDASTANQVTSEMQKTWQQQSSGILGASQMALVLATLPPAAQSLVRELIQSIQFWSVGNVAQMSAHVSLASATSAIAALDQAGALPGGGTQPLHPGRQ